MRLLLVFLLAAVVVAQNDDTDDLGSIFGAAIFDHVTGLGETHCAPGKCGRTCDGVLTESGCDEHEGPRADLLPPFPGHCATTPDHEVKNEWIKCECVPGAGGHGCIEKRDYPTIHGPEPMDRDFGLAGCADGGPSDCFKASADPKQVDFTAEKPGHACDIC